MLISLLTFFIPPFCSNSSITEVKPLMQTSLMNGTFKTLQSPKHLLHNKKYSTLSSLQLKRHLSQWIINEVNMNYLKPLNVETKQQLYENQMNPLNLFPFKSSYANFSYYKVMSSVFRIMKKIY